MEELTQRLAAWADAGLITEEQAERIAEHERPSPEQQQRQGTRPSRRVAVAEPVGYVGAALALAALGLFVGEFWPTLAVGGRLALVGVLTLVVAGAGQVLNGRDVPALQRLAGVLWAAAAVGGAACAGIVAADVVATDPELVASSVGIVGALIALPLLLRRPCLPLQLAALASLITTAIALLFVGSLRPDVFWDGVLVATIGGVWLLLGRGGWLLPRRTAEVLGGVIVLAGAQLGSFGDVRELALGLGLLAAGGLVVLAVSGEVRAHLVVGALGLFVLVPQLVFELFGDAIGAPATLLVVGLLLVLLAVALGRARREVTR